MSSYGRLVSWAACRLTCWLVGSYRVVAVIDLEGMTVIVLVAANFSFPSLSCSLMVFDPILIAAPAPARPSLGQPIMGFLVSLLLPGSRTGQHPLPPLFSHPHTTPVPPPLSSLVRRVFCSLLATGMPICSCFLPLSQLSQTDLVWRGPGQPAAMGR